MARLTEVGISTGLFRYQCFLQGWYNLLCLRTLGGAKIIRRHQESPGGILLALEDQEQEVDEPVPAFNDFSQKTTQGLCTKLFGFSESQPLDLPKVIYVCRVSVLIL